MRYLVALVFVVVLVDGTVDIATATRRLLAAAEIAETTALVHAATTTARSLSAGGEQDSYDVETEYGVVVVRGGRVAGIRRSAR